MDEINEKQRLFIEESSPLDTPPRRRSCQDRLLRHILPSVLLLLSVCILFRKAFVCHHHYVPEKYLPETFEDDWVMVNEDVKVAMEAHIMSKCPDAKDCLQQLVVPAMAQVSDKVDFKLSYIGTVDPNSDEVHCKHGPSECLGNIIQLCSAKVYPDPKIYLGFANCMTSQYQDIPKRELIEGCAMEHGIDFQRVNHCISQEGHGMELLRKSVEHSQDVNVSTSCTVRLEGNVRCVRDGGQWSNCDGGSSVSELVADINSLYDKMNMFSGDSQQ